MYNIQQSSTTITAATATSTSGSNGPQGNKQRAGQAGRLQPDSVGAAAADVGWYAVAFKSGNASFFLDRVVIIVVHSLLLLILFCCTCNDVAIMH